MEGLAEQLLPDALSEDDRAQLARIDALQERIADLRQQRADVDAQLAAAGSAQNAVSTQSSCRRPVVRPSNICSDGGSFVVIEHLSLQRLAGGCSWCVVCDNSSVSWTWQERQAEDMVASAEVAAAQLRLQAAEAAVRDARSASANWCAQPLALHVPNVCCWLPQLSDLK